MLQFDQLESLKRVLMPSSPTDVRNNQHELIDLLKLPLNGYKTMVSDFEMVFENFTRLNIRLQMEAVYLYMAFSHFIHLWKHSSRLEFAPEKMEWIKSLDQKYYPFIGKCINNINGIESQYYKNFTRYFHQTILLINGNLFNFVYNFLNGRILSEQEKIDFLDNIMFSVEDHLLDISRKHAQDRENKEPSQTERKVFNVLWPELKDTILAPLKSQVETHVDFMSGLELDFPLMKRITIETDGPCHVVGRAHHLAHSFKASLLNELGWVRVGLAADTYNIARKARFVASFLKIQYVLDFHIQYQKLIELLQKVRTRIIQLHKEKNLSPDFEFLMHLQNKLQNFIQSQNLKRLLTNPSQKALDVLDIHSRYLLGVQQAESANIEKLRLEDVVQNLEIEMVNADPEIFKLYQSQKILNQDLKLFREKLAMSPAHSTLYLKIKLAQEKILSLESIINNFETNQEYQKVTAYFKRKLPLADLKSQLKDVEQEFKQFNQNLKNENSAKPIVPSYNQHSSRKLERRNEGRYRYSPY